MASAADAEFTSFAQAVSSRLLGTAYLLCGDWHTAEDLTQTALAKVYASWPRISRKDAALAYARRTLLNHLPGRPAPKALAGSADQRAT